MESVLDGEAHEIGCGELCRNQPPRQIGWRVALSFSFILFSNFLENACIQNLFFGLDRCLESDSKRYILSWMVHDPLQAQGNFKADLSFRCGCENPGDYIVVLKYI